MDIARSNLPINPITVLALLHTFHIHELLGRNALFQTHLFCMTICGIILELKMTLVCLHNYFGYATSLYLVKCCDE